MAELPTFHKPRRRGFTLIEVMIVVALLAILGAIAIPSYMSQVRKSRRADAINLMSQVAQAQERWRGNNPTFHNDFGTARLGVRSTAASGVTSLTEPYYLISVPSGLGDAQNYTVRAVARLSQTSDTNCAVMEMRMTAGQLSYLAAPTVGALSTATPDPKRCWAR